MQKQLLLLLIIFSSVTSIVFGQKSANEFPVFEKIERALLSSEVPAFSLVETVTTDLVSKNIPATELKDGIVVDLKIADIQRLKNQKPNALELIFPLPNMGDVKVSLVQNKVLTSDFILRQSSSFSREINYEPGLYYTGVIKDDPNSLVSISIFDDEIISNIHAGADNFVIGKLQKSNSNQHIIYQDTELAEAFDFSCDTPDDDYVYSQKEITYIPTRALGNCIRVHLEIDDDIVTDKGGVVNATNYMTGLMNEVITLFANDNISMAISGITAWDTPSPYSGNTAPAMLNSYRLSQNDYTGDIGHLVSYKASGGQASGINTICPEFTGDSRCFSSINSYYNNVPLYSWSVNVMAHEMGHNLGSRHTHACVWNGDGTAIDGCENSEGDCSYAGLPTFGGTIMSYCHNRPVGINFNLGFGPQPQAVILNVIADAECLLDCFGPACDDGIMNGEETGVDCGGPDCLPCTCEGEEVFVNLVFDNNPGETRWQIRELYGDVEAEGLDYSSYSPGSSLTVPVCLPSNSCFEFVLFDSEQNGMCCEQGNGSYSVTNSMGEVLISGGEFNNYYDYSYFCIGSGTCDPCPVYGCVIPSAHNYNPDATRYDFTCETCSDGELNGDETGIDCGGALCEPCLVSGCPDELAHNYNPEATINDGTCETCNDGELNGDEIGIDCGGILCDPCIFGCSDPAAHNYNSAATSDDGSCETCNDGVMNGDETEIDCGGVLCLPCLAGCTDPLAHNYNAAAVTDDGSCETCNDGELNGDETEVDCGGVLCEPCNTNCEDIEVFLEINFNSNPDEIFWRFSNEDYSVFISGTDYDDQELGSSLVIPICLPDDCYNFSIFDDFSGDCTYTLTSDGVELSSGGLFVDSNVSEICVGDAAGVSGCTDPLAHNYNAAVVTDDGSCETCNDGELNGDETEVDCGGVLCEPCSTNCEDNEVFLEINFNSNPDEIFWRLSNEDYSVFISGTDYDNQEIGSSLVIPICLPDDCYNFSIFDDFSGDCTYTLTSDGVELASGGLFVDSNVSQICVGDVTPITGCTDQLAHNYNAAANNDDGSCETCEDGVLNGDETGIDCGGVLCDVCPVDGCTDQLAHNYNAAATNNDGTCETCNDGILNGDETAVDCGGALCEPCNTSGCNYAEALLEINFNSNPDEIFWRFMDNDFTFAAFGNSYGDQPLGSTLMIPVCLVDECYGFAIFDENGGNCTYTLTYNGIELASGVVPTYLQETEVCVGDPDLFTGCTDELAHNYNPQAATDDGTCETCSDGEQNGDEVQVDCGGELCEPCNTNCNDLEVFLELTFNVNPGQFSWDLINNISWVTVASGGYYDHLSAGSTLTIPICLVEDCYRIRLYSTDYDGVSCSYNIISNGVVLESGEVTVYETTVVCVEDGVPIAGCTDELAHNYNAEATDNDGTCETCSDGVLNGDEIEVDCGGTLCAPCIIYGCMNPYGYNYNPEATEDDGSCETCDDGIMNGDETDIDCGGSICNGGLNSVLVLDGIDDYVDLGIAAGNEVRTIEMWFKPATQIDNTLTTVSTLVARNNDDLGLQDLEFDVSFSPAAGTQGHLRFRLEDVLGVPYIIISDNNNWNADQWYHVAAVVSPTQGMSLYIDGQKQSETNAYNMSTGTLNRITAIGKWGDAVGQYSRHFHGSIDDLRFSTDAIYNANFTPKCPDISTTNSSKALWNFNEDGGSIAMDNSSNSFDGQLIGASRSFEEVCGGCPVSGCTDELAHNYNAAATDDDGTCETCSDGVLNGDETGIDCGGVLCEPCSNCDGIEVLVEINFDDYADETSWVITNEEGLNIASGEDYGSQFNGLNLIIPLCLPDGCFDFTINDTYGDGICCNYGNGSYSVTTNGEILASGGEFGALETTQICVGTIFGCLDETAHNYNSLANADDGSCETCTDGLINGDETDVDCGGGLCAPCECNNNEVIVEINLDNYPGETSWNITDKSGLTVAAGGPYNEDQAGASLIIPLCLSDGCFDFTINDSYGDGICCNYGTGYYSVTFNGEEVASGDSFEESETTQLCVSDADIIFGHYFETGWDGWSDGGNDCNRYQGVRSSEGEFSIRLRDNSGVASSMTSSAYDLSSYTSADVEFYFYAHSMEQGEDFWLQVRNGAGWQTVATYVSGTDFINNTYNGVTVSGITNLGTNTRFRFRCDASGNGDHIYIDAVILTAHAGGNRNRSKGIETHLTVLKRPTPQIENQKIDLESRSNELSLYPNPASTKISIEVNAAINGINVFAINGESVRYIQTDGQARMQVIDISDLNPGFYFVSVETADGVLTKRFVKVN